MRGMPVSGNSQVLWPNLSDADNLTANYVSPNSTGFNFASPGGVGQWIYIAIRRGPMKVPTVGTSVFSPVVRTGTNAVASITGLGFAPDLAVIKFRTAAVDNVWYDRLRGPNLYLAASNTNVEDSYSPSVTSYNNAGITFGDDLAQGVVNANGISYINWLFGRAPSFFDEVCYTGTGSGQVINHNLGVTPELLIFKARNNYASSGYEYWYTNAPNTTYALALNSDVGESYTKISSANSTTVSLGSSNNYVLTNQTYVAYLFATCAGVSKVGSYTGTGTTLQIDCGFTAGARFVLIKRTDSTGGWFVWDTARGIVAGNDPYLLLNSTAAEVTNTDYVDTYNAGFEISSTAPAAINSNGGSFIFLAIA